MCKSDSNSSTLPTMSLRALKHSYEDNLIRECVVVITNPVMRRGVRLFECMHALTWKLNKLIFKALPANKIYGVHERHLFTPHCAHIFYLSVCHIRTRKCKDLQGWEACHTCTCARIQAYAVTNKGRIEAMILWKGVSLPFRSHEEANPSTGVTSP